MPSRPIVERLTAGERLLMDGGTGSEIQRRGADVLKGSTGNLQAWSATANTEFADVVQQVHQDYLRVGADVIISNNFWTTPSRLGYIGLQDEWAVYARAAAENALRARDAMNPEAYVWGGIAVPSLYWGRGLEPTSDIQVLGRDVYYKEHNDHAKLLADMGVDAILTEYIGFIDECVLAAESSESTGLPVFIGVRHLTENGDMQYGNTFDELVEALQGRRVDGILIMCSNPEAATAGLPKLRKAFAGPVGVYPNLGYNPTGPVRKNNTGLTNQKKASGTDDILQSADYYPSRMAGFAAQWADMGAQIIGGCCASGPEHIMAMGKIVKANA